MILGASYNLFDGEELLESSIKSIRNNVDFISVVFQTQSNFGNLCHESIPDLLIDLQKKKLIDEVIHYNPDLSKHPHENERNKRNIGLEASREKGCTHHLSIDTDEFYNTLQFDNAKEIIEENNFDSSVCRLQTYYKNDHTILWPLEDYYVSFIYKIRPNVVYAPMPFPVLVDPTRRMEAGSMMDFEHDELLMHHFSYVRKDLRSKLENSSAKQNWDNDMMQRVIDHYNNWKEGMGALMAPATAYATKQIKSIFDVHI